MKIHAFAGCVALVLAGCATKNSVPLQLCPPRAGVTGNIERLPSIASKFVPARNVDVWLPPDYFTSQNHRRYPVLYLHDGQNVFDPATSFIGVDWGVDETMTRLIAGKKIRPTIVVAIWNTTNRLAEYMPQRPLELDAAADLDERFKPARQHPLGDAYLRYLVTELKPAIDARYRTLPDRAHTFIMGSSMGGLISLHAICEYPRIFGGAACLSTAWPVVNGIVVKQLKNLPSPRTHKIYFDYGTETLDASYEPFQRRVDELMRKADYVSGKNWLTGKFPGAEHSERAWSKRVNVPLEFLLGEKP